jgi:hypothetical protein
MWHPHFKKNWISDTNFEIIDLKKESDISTFIQVNENKFLNPIHIMDCKCKFIEMSNYNPNNIPMSHGMMTNEVYPFKNTSPGINEINDIVEKALKAKQENQQNSFNSFFQKLSDQISNLDNKLNKQDCDNSKESVNTNINLLKQISSPQPLPNLTSQQYDINQFKNLLEPAGTGLNIANIQRTRTPAPILNPMASLLNSQMLLDQHQTMNTGLSNYINSIQPTSHTKLASFLPPRNAMLSNSTSNKPMINKLMATGMITKSSKVDSQMINNSMANNQNSDCLSVEDISPNINTPLATSGTIANILTTNTPTTANNSLINTRSANNPITASLLNSFMINNPMTSPTDIQNLMTNLYYNSLMMDNIQNLLYSQALPNPQFNSVNQIASNQLLNNLYKLNQNNYK